MPFKPDANNRTVKDEASGVVLRIRQPGADTSALTVTTEGLTMAPLSFSMDVPSADNEASDTKECGVKILVGGVEYMFQRKGMHDKAHNTEVFAKIIEGILAFNAVWPLSNSYRVCSDMGEAIRRGTELSFSMPSDDELAELIHKSQATS